MNEREPISKRLRFEVFKRDSFTCQYCGATPPAAVLHCDHIHPVSLGGQTDIDNLVTACQSCNLGKSNVLLANVPRSLQDRAAEIEEREAQIAGYEAILRARRERLDAAAQRILDEYCGAFGRESIPQVDYLSIRRFVETLGFEVTFDAMQIALQNGPPTYARSFKYFCGVCWNKIRERDEP